ncbi:MAG: hypothetical protein IT193_20010 [Propionibacteriaceae bacterium]|nr:hypothetical protein [Propionibacteriaceae bacterium]
MELGSSHQFWVMKAPMDAALQPDWEQFASWETETQTRSSIARRNSKSLGGLISSAEDQDELFRYRLDEHPVDSFLFVWGGEITSGLTAGWLTVPVLGASPFAATTRLWRDETGEYVVGSQPLVPAGPSYDEREPVTPSLRLKPRGVGAMGDRS